MTVEKLRVAVLMGGQSAERDVSLRTGAAILRELGSRHLVKPIEIREDGRWVVPPGYGGSRGTGLETELSSSPAKSPGLGGEPASLQQALLTLADEGVDVVFNGLHGPLGEDGTVQGLFRLAGIPLTGPDVAPAAVTMDKRLTKQVLIGAGVPTPRFFVLPAAYAAAPPPDAGDRLRGEAGRCPLPWIVKPNRLGSSVGVAVYDDVESLLRESPERIRRWPPQALGESIIIEEVVRGRELTCGVLETAGAARALPPVEIRPRTSTFFDYDAKYVVGASEEICPAPLSPEATALVEETALRVHALFECAPLSRTDMFLCRDGGIQVLEVNTLPGMTETSLIPLSAAKAGILLADLLDGILEHAIRRAGGMESPGGGGVCR